MRGDDPKQRDPVVKNLRRATQDLAARDEQVQRSAATAFEKSIRAVEQANCVRGREIGEKERRKDVCVRRSTVTAPPGVKVTPPRAASA